MKAYQHSAIAPNTVACSIDFSASSRRVLQYAATFAREMNAHLTVLYVFRLTCGSYDEVVARKRMTERDVLGKFRVLEKDILTDQDISYSFITEIGFMKDRLEAHAKKNPQGVIVIDKKLMFENAETFNELVDHIRIPTLIIP